MMNIGRLCVKTAGRDAGLRCVVLSSVKNNRVLIDGETRRRLCNVGHLEPLPTLVEVKEEASHEEVGAALQPLGITVLSTKSKKVAPRPRTLRRSKLAKKEAPQKKVVGVPKVKAEKPAEKAVSVEKTPEKKEEVSVTEKPKNPRAKKAVTPEVSH